MRPVSIRRRYLKFPPASVLMVAGDTQVICTASVAQGAPPFLEGTGRGWVTAEYAMIPGSTPTRKEREIARGRPDGRSQEIRRLIGRCMRAAVDLAVLGERTITIDCDVIQADGGTRTAAVTGGFVALVDCLRWMRRQGMLKYLPLRTSVAAVSVGLIDGTPMLDLTYQEDHRAEVDMNVVMTGQGQFIEVQGTAEHGAFSQNELLGLLALARKGCTELMDAQRRVLRMRKVLMGARGE